MESQHNHWIAASLAQRSGKNPAAIQTADAVLLIWEEIASALRTVIGRQGVAALYDRSVSLTSRAHPWMAGARAGANSSVDLALQSVVAQQDDSAAVAGAAELLQTLYDVLVSLIGSALCDQLLLSVRESAAHPLGPRDT